MTMETETQGAPVSADARRRWFQRAWLAIPESLEGEAEDGGPMILDLDSDPDGDGTTPDRCGRYLVLEKQQSTDEWWTAFADEPEQLRRIIAGVVDDAQGEGYGWQVERVLDLETGEPVEWDVRIEVDLGRRGTPIERTAWVLARRGEVLAVAAEPGALKRLADRREGGPQAWELSDSHGRMWRTAKYDVQEAPWAT
jgi:hypothetical protein